MILEIITCTLFTLIVLCQYALSSLAGCCCYVFLQYFILSVFSFSTSFLFSFACLQFVDVIFCMFSQMRIKNGFHLRAIMVRISQHLSEGEMFMQFNFTPRRAEARYIYVSNYFLLTLRYSWGYPQKFTIFFLVKMWSYSPLTCFSSSKLAQKWSTKVNNFLSFKCGLILH